MGLTGIVWKCVQTLFFIFIVTIQLELGQVESVLTVRFAKK